jgi:hypothetical protein
MSALTKKEWMKYIEKTWDAAQKEAWSEPQFECPRCGHCCQIQQAAQQAVEVMDAHMMRADTDEFYEAKEALRQALETEQNCGQVHTTPPKKQWVGLTIKEVLINRHLIDWTSEWSYLEFAREIERALKEKNT